MDLQFQLKFEIYCKLCHQTVQVKLKGTVMIYAVLSLEFGSKFLAGVHSTSIFRSLY